MPRRRAACVPARAIPAGAEPARLSKLAAAGLEAIEIEPTRIYDACDAKEFLAAEGIDTGNERHNPCARTG